MSINCNLLISVIIPIFNSERYLKTCLDSVINQSYKNIEIICIDDCSNDESAKILKEYSSVDSRIKCLFNETNIGAGLSRNRGVDVSNGDYIMFLDSDDWLQNNGIEKLISYIKEYDKPEIISYMYYDYNQNTKKTELLQKLPDEYKNKILNIYNAPKCVDCLGYGMSKLLSREFLLKHNIKFNDDICSEDVEHYLYLILNAKRILFTNELVFYYRHTNKSRSTKRYLYIDYYIKHINMIRSLSENFPNEVINLLFNRLYSDFINACIKSYVYNKISFPELKMVIEKYIDNVFVQKNPESYSSMVYNKMFLQNKSPLYFRLLFSVKIFFPTYFKIYLNVKNKLQFKRGFLSV